MKMGALIWLRCGGFLQLRCREGISTRTLTHPRHPHIPPTNLGQPKVNGPRDAQVIAWRQSCCATRVDRDGFFLRKDREKIIGKHHIPPTTKDMEGENLGEECRWRFWSGCYFWKVLFVGWLEMILRYKKCQNSFWECLWHLIFILCFFPALIVKPSSS